MIGTKKIIYFLLSLTLFLTPMQAQEKERIHTRQKKVLAALEQDAPVSCDSLMRIYMEYAKVKVTEHNRVKLLMSGREKFTDLFDAIKKAKHHIHLEYFNFRNDSIAGELFTLLARKAKEGVEVRALFDAFGNWSNSQPLKKRHLKMIREKDIEIVKFDPLTFPWFNHAAHRDHRKIVVIDGRVAYTGGMNIADYYINGLPKLGAWHDIHMRIEGEAVAQLQGVFLTMWNRETKQHIGGPEYFSNEVMQADSTNIEIAIVDRTPKETPRSISHAYAASIFSAQDRIRIVNPYFLPTSSIRKSIRAALKKGTEVEIMVPAKSDIPFTPEATLYITHKLMKQGAKIYLFNGGFHHSKIMMVDSTFCTVGTANLNSRSLRWDYETNAFIFDSKTNRELNEMFDRDKENSTLMTPEYWKKRSPWKKFVGWFGNLLTPFL